LKLIARQAQPGVRSIERNGQGAGDLRYRAAVDVVQNKDRAPFDVHLIQGEAREIQSLGLHEVLERVRRRIRRLGVDAQELTAIAEAMTIIRRDPKREAEQPRSQRAPGVIICQTLIDAKEHIVCQVLEISLRNAEPAQRIPHVVELRFEHLRETRRFGR